MMKNMGLLSICLCCILNITLTACKHRDFENSKKAAPSEANPPKNGFGDFSGEILPVFYVRDVRRSVAFYHDTLGFDFDHFWNYDKNEPAYVWTDAEPPIYARMGAGDQKFALHLYQGNEKLAASGMLHYFGVSDVDKHHERVQAKVNGLDPLIDRPWMRMFSVKDPDGHCIFFFTRPKSWIN